MMLESNSGKVSILEAEKGDSVAILSHGYLSNKQSRTNTELASLLNASGISAISYDIYGHGESEGDVEHLTISKAVDSLDAVYDYAESKYRKIALVGSSFTGSITLIAASRRDPSAIALKCPVFLPIELWNWRMGKKGIEQWKKKGFVEPFGRRWSYEAYEDALKYDMRGIAARIKAPALVVHGDKDITVPLSHAENLVFSLGSEEKRLVVIEGADHFFRKEGHFDRMSSLISEWLAEHLS